MPIPLGVLAVAGAGAAGGSDYVLLESQILTSNTATITFSSIPQTYKHLQIRGVSRQASGANTQLNLRFNGDTGTNYVSHFLFGSGSAVSSSAQTSRSSIIFGQSTGSGETANIFSPVVMDILDYSNSSKNTTTRLFSSFNNSLNWILMRSGLWMNTAAVTSISFTADSATDMVAGSRFSLYGIK